MDFVGRLSPMLDNNEGVGPGDVGLSQPEESDWKGDGRTRLNREGWASSSEEEYFKENEREDAITRIVRCTQ